ncbi:hypothetical protein SO802_029965, partial [Lithocarpus litseifolius]
MINRTRSSNQLRLTADAKQATAARPLLIYQQNRNIGSTSMSRDDLNKLPCKT